MSTTPWVPGVGASVLLACSFFFSASETALFSIRRERAVLFRQSKSRSRKIVYELISNGQRTLLMILIGNTFVNIALPGFIDAFIEAVRPGSGAIVTVASSMFIIIVFGEMVPKNIAIRHNEKVACLFAPPLSALQCVFAPVVSLMRSVNELFLTRFRLRLRRPGPFVTLDEMKSGVVASRKSGAISSEEQDMIVRLLDRGTLPVARFAVHRRHLTLLPPDVTCEAALEKLRALRQLIVFVYDCGNTGRILGRVHCSALARSAPDQRLGELVQPLTWVLSTMEVAEAIGLLFEKGCSDAGVIDEYGSFAGLFSLTSGLRNVLAPISDEEGAQAVQAAKPARLFSGDTELETMDGWLPGALVESSRQARTLNGALTGYLGFIPQTGDKFAIEGYNFYITSACPVKIESILIRKREAV